MDRRAWWALVHSEWDVTEATEHIGFIEVISGPATPLIIPLMMGDLLPSSATLHMRTFSSRGRVGRGLGLDSEDLTLRACLSGPFIWQMTSLLWTSSSLSVKWVYGSLDGLDCCEASMG